MTLILIDLPNNIHLRITKYKVVYDVIDSLGFPIIQKKNSYHLNLGNTKYLKDVGEG